MRIRSRKSKIDHEVRLKTSIREAIIQKLHLAIFFDQEKAYETTWSYGIMNDLHNKGLKNRLLNFIKAFFFGQEIPCPYWFTPIKYPKSRRGSPSGKYTVSNPLQQKINNITNSLNPAVVKFLFVDDIWITSSSKYIRRAERQLQQGISKINK